MISSAQGLPAQWLDDQTTAHYRALPPVQRTAAADEQQRARPWTLVAVLVALSIGLFGAVLLGRALLHGMTPLPGPIQAAPKPVVVAPPPAPPAPAPAPPAAASEPQRAAAPESPPPEAARETPKSKRPLAASASGTLRVNSLPWSQVYLDGQLIGNTPLQGVSVAPGTHSLRLVNPQLSMIKTRTLKLRAGEVVTLIEHLAE